MEEEPSVIEEYIRKEIGDWEDEEVLSARYKAFSGQKSDWEPKYFFWRDLIIKIARTLKLFIIRPSQVKNSWFNRGGLTPLCLDHVLLEMYNAGDVLSTADLVDPKTGRLTHILNKVRHLVGLTRSSSPPLDFPQDRLIISTLLREKAVEIVKLLSDNHWTSSCIVTMSKFQEICGGPMEAYAISSHLSECGKLKYLAIKKNDLIEGVKVSVTLISVNGTTSLDYDVLHLTWTAEKLQQKLDVLDQRSGKSKKLLLASLKSGNKVDSWWHARELKLTSQSRERSTTLLNRVEEVLRVIADAADSKEVYEAIQIGAKAIKENNVTMEEVHLCLEELDESIDSQKQVEKVLASTSSYSRIEDEEIEDELEKLELEDGRESSQVSVDKVVDSSVGETRVLETESLSNSLSKLNLVHNAGMESVMQEAPARMNLNVPKDLNLEAA